MSEKNVMRGILASLVVIVMLVGCQTVGRVIELPTPQMKVQPSPAVLLEKPVQVEQEEDDVWKTILMFRQGCQEKKAFWIRYAGKIESYSCELSGISDDNAGQ